MNPIENTPPSTPSIRAFQIDNRDNPELHNMHVHWACQTLKIAHDAIESLMSLHRCSAISIASALATVMKEEIARDAAFFEAAALLFASLEPPKQSE
jgi:hypothetical protein